MRVDNGPENISKQMHKWSVEHKVKLLFIQPGKPAQNGYIQQFNRSYREAVLSRYLFEDLEQVQILTDEWLEHYNYQRPHESLNNLKSYEFGKTKTFSTLELY